MSARRSTPRQIARHAAPPPPPQFDAASPTPALASTPWQSILGDGNQGGVSPSLDLRPSCLSNQRIPFEIRRTYDIDLRQSYLSNQQMPFEIRRTYDIDLRQSYLSNQQMPFEIRRTYGFDACILPLHSLGAFRTPFQLVYHPGGLDVSPSRLARANYEAPHPASPVRV